MLLSLSSLILLHLGTVHSDGLNPMYRPLAGDNITVEIPYTITWKVGTPGPVRIELHWGDSSLVTIVDETDNNGSYTWIPSDLYGGKNNFFMDICDNNIANECTYTADGRFAIVSDDITAASSSISPSSTSLVSGSSSITTSSPTTAFQSSFTSIPSHATPSATPSATSSPQPPNTGLSVGAKTGIGVGIAILGVGASVLGAFFWGRRRDRRGRSQVQETSAGEKTVYARSELPAESHNTVRAELEGTQGNLNRTNVQQTTSDRASNDLPEWRR